MSHPLPTATILGYPRIGPNRELKRALEAYWAGRTNAADFRQVTSAVRRGTRTRLTELGLDPTTAAIPSDFAHYDQVLATAIQVGAVPGRFGIEPTGSPLGLDEEFRLARGDAKTPPLELTKWFDSNYHYLVPEISPATPLRHIPGGQAVAEFAEALADGVLTRPVLVGPVTLLLLAKPENAGDPAPSGWRICSPSTPTGSPSWPAPVPPGCSWTNPPWWPIPGTCRRSRSPLRPSGPTGCWPG